MKRTGTGAALAFFGVICALAGCDEQPAAPQDPWARSAPPGSRTTTSAPAPAVTPDSAAPLSSETAPSPADGTQLTEGGYLPTKPRQAIDGSPFLVPDPLPECARPVSCDVEPPPEQRGIVVRVLCSRDTKAPAHEPRPGELAYARAIAGARDGSAYYVVDNMGRITKLDASLHVRAVVRTPEIERGKPTGLSVARNGELWVADTHYARVLVYSPDLVLLRSWGVPGAQPGGFLFLRACEGVRRRQDPLRRLRRRRGARRGLRVRGEDRPPVRHVRRAPGRVPAPHEGGRRPRAEGALGRGLGEPPAPGARPRGALEARHRRLGDGPGSSSIPTTWSSTRRAARGSRSSAITGSRSSTAKGTASPSGASPAAARVRSATRGLALMPAHGTGPDAARHVLVTDSGNDRIYESTGRPSSPSRRPRAGDELHRGAPSGCPEFHCGSSLRSP